MFTGPIHDRLEIRERYDAYSDAVCRTALDDYLACWSDTPVRLGDGGEFRDRDGLLAHWHCIWQVLDHMTFVTQIGAIDISGERASARSYCLEIMTFRDGTRHQVVGGYEDQLHRTGASWVFAERRYRVLDGGPSRPTA